MNVGELKEALDDYGDHVPVVLVIEKGNGEKVYKDYDVTDTSAYGEPTVTLLVSI